MKILKVFVLPLFLLAFTNIQAFANSPTSKTSELRKEIIELVDSIDLSEMESDSQTLRVQFVINSKKEIVVLNIEDSSISNQVLGLLDRRDIETEGIETNKLYVLPIVFNKK